MAGRGSFRNDITGLRAIAVLSVIVFHLNAKFLPGGFLGVDIFFVISGYVITLSLLNYPSLSPGSFLLEFYKRRLRRLLPALLAMVVISAAAICLVDPEPLVTLRTGMAATFGFSNIYLYVAGADYFASSTEFNIFTHTWSLGVEEQFYFIFPLMMWLLLKYGEQRKAAFLTIFGACIVLSFAIFEWAIVSHPSASFYLLPPRFWELGCGAFICVAARDKRPQSAALALLGLAGIIAAFLFPEGFSWATTPLTVAAASLLILTNRQGSALDRFLNSSTMTGIGLISYSLYLWHWPVIVLSRWTTGVDLLALPFIIAAMFGLAVLSYRFIETPLRRDPRGVGRGRAVAGSLAAAAVGSLLLLGFTSPTFSHAYLGTRGAHRAGTSSKMLERSRIAADRAERLSVDCNMTPQYLSGKSRRTPPKLDDAFFDHCLEPAGTGPKVLLVGDSFANRTTKHLGVIADRAGMTFGLVFGYNCPFPLELSDIADAPRRDCPDARKGLISSALAKALKPGDILVVRLYLPKVAYVRYDGTRLPPPDAFDAALRKLADLTRSRGAGLLLIGANPTLSASQVLSLSPQWFQRRIYTETVPPDANDATAYFHILDRHLLATLPQTGPTQFMSLKPYFCDSQDMCRLRNRGDVYYIDDVHLSGRAYDLFADDLAHRIKQMRQALVVNSNPVSERNYHAID